MRPWLAASALVCLVACRRDAPAPPTPPPPASPVPVSPEGPSVGASVAQMAVATAPPTVTSAPAAAAPAVDVRSIGMHIGGGPNDDATKAPFLTAIAASHGEVARCWATLGKRVTVDFGVDFLVPAKGGLAKVDRPRSTVPDAAFVKCATAAFSSVTFAPTKSGLATKVSTSVRLVPR